MYTQYQIWPMMSNTCCQAIINISVMAAWNRHTWHT